MTDPAPIAPRAAVVRRLFTDAWNGGEFDFAFDHLAASVTFHYNGATRQTSPDDLPRLVAKWRESFPDLRFEIHEVVASHDLVAIRLTLTGTHRGMWSGMAASGRSVRVAEMMLFRFEGDLIVEMWETFDELGLLRQIGASPGG